LNIDYLKVVKKKSKRVIERYQRSKEPRRIRKIVNFLSTQQRNSVLLPILPQNVVLNVRKKFHATRIRGDLYRIPDRVRFQVVDGQHRIEALIKLEINLPLPVTITTGLSEIQEGALFLLINHTQKRVPASIRMLDIAGMRRRRLKLNLQPLLDVLGFTGADVRTLDIAAEQALKKDHFWYDKITLPRSEEE